MRLFSYSTFIVVILFLSGCGPARPKDMPQTAPCTVTVLQEGKPMQDVIVTLYYDKGSASLNIDGTTDASGVAEIKTTWGSYTTAGAPVGTCKVTINKYFDIPPETVTAEESALWTKEQGDRYERERKAMVDKLRIVPIEIANISHTPLTVTVEARSGGSLTVDINDYAEKK